MSYMKIYWVLLIRVSGYVNYASALVAMQLGDIQHMPKRVGLSLFTWDFKEESSMEVLKSIKQNCNY